MADYLPKFAPGGAVTFTALAAVTGGRLVAVVGNRLVGSAAADSATTVGVAGFDAEAGDPVTIYTRSAGIHRLTAAGPIAAGAKVACAAAGKVQTIGALLNPLGVALQPAFADMDVIDVLFV